MAGIIGYGAYIPRNRIRVEEIAKVWGADAPSYKKGLMLEEKSVPSPDQDTITMSVEAVETGPQAGRNRSPGDRRGLHRLGVASLRRQAERDGRGRGDRGDARPSTPPTSSSPARPGRRACSSPSASSAPGRSSTPWPSGPTRRRARPATPSSTPRRRARRPSSSARDRLVAEVLETYSYMTDTPDFWRREYQYYPRHGGRFTGEPAYFKHVTGCGPGHHGEGRAEAGRLRVRRLPSAQRQVPLPRRRDARLHQAADRARLARPQARQHLLRLLAAGADGDARHRQARGPHPHGLLRLGRGQRRASSSRVTERIDEVRDLAPRTRTLLDTNKVYLEYGAYAKYRRKIRKAE